MRRFFILFLILSFTAMLPVSGFSEDNESLGWKSQFTEALKKGKMPISEEGGLAYTPSEEVVLEEAVKGAMQEEAPPCEAMTIAVELEYNPYMVMKNIYSFEGELNLDQLCMCATQKGISKQVIAKAAMDARRNGEPAFMPDEVTQSSCLQADEGLAYTMAEGPPAVVPPVAVPVPQSRSVP